MAGRTLAGLALLAAAVLDVALAALPGRFPEWPALVLAGCAFAQVATAAAWAVLGAGPWFARMAAPVVTAAALAALAAPHVTPSAPELFGAFLLVAGIVAAPCIGLRWAGLRFEAENDRGRGAASIPARRRYSMADLFALTTLVALGAAAARVVAFPTLHRANAMLDLVVVAATALLGLFLMAFVLGAGRGNGNQTARGLPDGAPGKWFVLLLSLAVGDVVAVGLSEPAAPNLGILGVEAAFCLAAAWVLHCCGYRLAWRARPPTLPAPCRSTRES
jgi:hypothetical protein